MSDDIYKKINLLFQYQNIGNLVTVTKKDLTVDKGIFKNINSNGIVNFNYYESNNTLNKDTSLNLNDIRYIEFSNRDEILEIIKNNITTDTIFYNFDDYNEIKLDSNYNNKLKYKEKKFETNFTNDNNLEENELLDNSDDDKDFDQFKVNEELFGLKYEDLKDEDYTTVLNQNNNKQSDKTKADKDIKIANNSDKFEHYNSQITKCFISDILKQWKNIIEPKIEEIEKITPDNKLKLDLKNKLKKSKEIKNLQLNDILNNPENNNNYKISLNIISNINDIFDNYYYDFGV